MNIFQRIWGAARRGLTRLGSVIVKITDDRSGWQQIQSGGGPVDRPWAEVQQDQLDSLEAWRKNFLIRQIVRLTTSYVVGDGIALSSEVPEVNLFLKMFWEHEENHISDRLPGWCDELTRSGEIFPVLFTNKITGMSHVRVIPASQIESIETDPNDYEKETYFYEIQFGVTDRKRWRGWRTARVFSPYSDGRQRRPDPMMLHYAINKVVGATRGEGDLGPILPWAKRYTEWLKDRVRFNRLRTRLAAAHVEIDDDGQVASRQEYYNSNPPVDGAVIVTGRGEKLSFPSANIQGFDAEPDGKAQRLAFAAGANVPLHFLGEGSSATRSTATEMGDPTHRHYRMRQQVFVGFLVDLASRAWRRYESINNLKRLIDLGITASAPDVSRADNQSLATAARTAVEAFSVMKGEGWIDDDTAVRLSFKFAGEILPEDKILGILKGGKDEQKGKSEFSSNGAGATIRA